MTSSYLRITVIAVLAAAAGCAQQPVKSASNAPVAAPSKAAPAQAAPSGISKQLMAMARDNGYRPEVRHGRTFFCRYEIPVGSNLPIKHCVDANNLRWEVQYQQQVRRNLEQGAPIVGQPNGN